MFLPIKSEKSILALGAEFDTRLAFYCAGEVVLSKNTDEIAQYPEKLEKFILDFLHFVAETHCNAFLPDVIITDLHPLYNSRKIGEKLAKKWKIPCFMIQHHIAHIFSAVGDYIFQMRDTKYKILNTDFYGIACDGTGYGLDENIWGGEVFLCHPERSRGISDSSIHPPKFCQRQNLGLSRNDNYKFSDAFNNINIQRIGHLEEQYLIGGELAIKEPARMAISILSKFLTKQKVFAYVKKYYSARDFNLLWNQIEQKFNYTQTTSAGRALDVVSLLLGFCENERKYKHYSIKMLEKYTNMQIMQTYECQRIKTEGTHYLKPKIERNKKREFVLNTTELFKYLIDNSKKIDKQELGAMAQRYIIEGLYEIARIDYTMSLNLTKVFFSGGLAENKIMRRFAENNNIYIQQKISCGDAGIAFGQITAFLLNVHPRNCQNNLEH